MARPKKLDNLIKNKRLNVKMTEPEYLIVIKNVESSGLTISEYIRRCLLNKKVIIRKVNKVDMPEIRDIKANLGKIGSNINQIAKYFNQGGYRSSQVLYELHNCMDEIHKAFSDLSKLAGDESGNN